MPALGDGGEPGLDERVSREHERHRLNLVAEGDAQAVSEPLEKALARGRSGLSVRLLVLGACFSDGGFVEAGER